MINGHDSGIWEVPTICTICQANDLSISSCSQPGSDVFLCQEYLLRTQWRKSWENLGTWNTQLEALKNPSGNDCYSLRTGKLPLYIYVIYIQIIYILYTYYDLPSSKMLMFRRWLQQK